MEIFKFLDDWLLSQWWKKNRGKIPAYRNIEEGDIIDTDENLITDYPSVVKELLVFSLDSNTSYPVKNFLRGLIRRDLDKKVVICENINSKNIVFKVNHDKFKFRGNTNFVQDDYHVVKNYYDLDLLKRAQTIFLIFPRKNEKRMI